VLCHPVAAVDDLVEVQRQQQEDRPLDGHGDQNLRNSVRHHSWRVDVLTCACGSVMGTIPCTTKASGT
jgi:hypothetical protein